MRDALESAIAEFFIRRNSCPERKDFWVLGVLYDNPDSAPRRVLLVAGAWGKGSESPTALNPKFRRNLHLPAAESGSQVRRTNMSYFVPPCNYGMVEHDLSRSGQCHQLNFPFLERHNLKTVIYLSYDEPSQPFLSFLEDQGIDLIRPSPELAEIHGQASSMSEAEVLSALQVILSSQYYPLHVMCNFGHHRTGTVIGCLRKLQGWNLTAIFEEYRRYAGSKVRFLNEQFIELFDTDLVRIPVDHPSWL